MPPLSILATACCFLFVPANRPERLGKALACGDGAVIVDLEDAVAPADKITARMQWVQAFASVGESDRARLLVRINAAGTPWHEDDLAMVRQITAQGLGGVAVPKAESAAQLAHVLAHMVMAAEARVLVPLIESARGMGALDELANCPGVLRLALGHLDLQADMGMRCDVDEAELQSARFALVAASRRADLASPVDGVTVAIGDTARLQADTARSRRFGFGAKLCIHPAQLATIAAVFAPTQDELEWAQRVMAAQARAAGAAFSLDGRMVDAPVVLLAQQTLARTHHTKLA
ncbi:citryl-CoA lyase [Hydrogenophaga crassostreae]|uniref:Citryl-CoA lyase n=1 Tax=Hydrogenophaga crassostreae TaxID=1763535 RepID=A0A170AK29_9BURK|nr:CoA ester lyase [Hydrogenophaga crassostreae]AOW13891.1 CoA ester lyase [Hydrogenophaga crassostreae]OAD44148.1 citryl-CoA lyase [Hydrogenophaga crassostreae]